MTTNCMLLNLIYFYSLPNSVLLNADCKKFKFCVEQTFCAALFSFKTV